MRRPRPHIPLSVRVEVAEREVEKGLWWPLYCSAVEVGGMTLGKRLTILLDHLPKGVELDHDPALIRRQFNPETGKYTPDANDPAYLTYREKLHHLEKTIGRKHDAEKTVTTKGSDIWFKTKFQRLENPSTKPRAKIPSRPFPKGRPFPKRKSRGGTS